METGLLANGGQRLGLRLTKSGGTKGGIKVGGLKDPFVGFHCVGLISYSPPSFTSPFE